MVRISNNVIEETRCNFIKIEKQVKTSLLTQNTPCASRGFSITAWLYFALVVLFIRDWQATWTTSYTLEAMQERNLVSQVRYKISFCEWQETPRKSFAWEFLDGMCLPFLQQLQVFWPYLRQKKCHFPHPFSDLSTKIHTHFQTRHRQKSCHHCLDKNTN